MIWVYINSIKMRRCVALRRRFSCKSCVITNPVGAGEQNAYGDRTMNKMKHGELQSVARDFIEAMAKATGDSEKAPEYITYDEACEIAKVSRWTVRRWTKIPDCGIIVIKLGSSPSSPVRIDKASFIAFLASRMVKAEVSEPQEINNGNKKGGESK